MKRRNLMNVDDDDDDDDDTEDDGGRGRFDVDLKKIQVTH